MPAILVSNLAPAQVVSTGPFEHTSTLALIESTFGLSSLTARDANAQNLAQVLLTSPLPQIPSGTIPTSAQVVGPVNDAATVCSASTTQSLSPAAVNSPPVLPEAPWPALLPVGAALVGGMVAFGRHHRNQQAHLAATAGIDAAAALTTVEAQAPTP